MIAYINILGYVMRKCDSFNEFMFASGKFLSLVPLSHPPRSIDLSGDFVLADGFAGCVATRATFQDCGQAVVELQVKCMLGVNPRYGTGVGIDVLQVVLVISHAALTTLRCCSVVPIGISTRCIHAISNQKADLIAQFPRRAKALVWICLVMPRGFKRVNQPVLQMLVNFNLMRLRMSAQMGPQTA
jgi:hypothetical protein